MRVACLDLPGFPLQLVWRQRAGVAAASGRRDRRGSPAGRGAVGVRAGARRRACSSGSAMRTRCRCAAGCGARVSPGQHDRGAIAELRAVLHRLSPGVEPGEPGTFWLDGDGLDRVFPDGNGPSGRAWGAAIARAVAELGYRGAVVVGFSRFATYAIARATRGRRDGAPRATPRSARRPARCRSRGSTSTRSCAMRSRGSA